MHLAATLSIAPGVDQSPCIMSDLRQSKRARIDDGLRHVVLRAGTNHAATARVIAALHDSGLLKDDVSVSSGCRVKLSRLAGDLGSTATPYGNVMQTMKLPIASGDVDVPFLHPMALVHVLTAANHQFASVLQSAIDRHGTLSIVLFIDECKPGNVLRPDKGRAVQNVFWTFAELPSWLLCKQDSWMTFAAVRSTIVGKLPGDASQFMKIVVNKFWPATGFSFERGCSIKLGNGDHKMSTARLGGLLGDEKGLKDIFGTKGPGGTRPCISCKNIIQFVDEFVDGTGYLQCISCTDPSKFDKSADEFVYAIVDKLSTLSGGTKKALAEAEQNLGLNYVPDGMLWDAQCRNHVRPVTGWLRDWMHVMSVSGCANIEIQQVMSVLREHGVLATMVTDYFAKHSLPSAHGKVNPDWFTVKRMGKPIEDKDGWKGFSSEVLSMVPILRCFLEDTIAPTGVMLRNVECFKLLHELMSMFQVGYLLDRSHVVRMRDLISSHAVIFNELYPDAIKPKYHHLHHVPDHLQRMGVLLMCFVTERKHRTVKSAATATFGNFEKGIAVDVLRRAFDVANDVDTFSAESLVNKKPINDGLTMLLQSLVQHKGQLFGSKTARLVCGTVKAGDIVMTSDRIVHEVMVFFGGVASEVDNSIFVLLATRSSLGGRNWSSSSTSQVIACTSDVLAPVIWAPVGDGIVVVPPAIVVADIA